MAVLKYLENNEWKSLSFIEVENGTDGSVDTSSLVSKAELLNMVYPVGSIYMSMNSVNPSTIFGGSWVSISNGRVLVGQWDGDERFSQAGVGGGEFSHTLTIDEMPKHTHEETFPVSDTMVRPIGRLETGSYQSPEPKTSGSYKAFSNSFPNISANSSTPIYPALTVQEGGGQPHSNLQPYLVCYIWQRTA